MNISDISGSVGFCPEGRLPGSNQDIKPGEEAGLLSDHSLPVVFMHHFSSELMLVSQAISFQGK